MRTRKFASEIFWPLFTGSKKFLEGTEFKIFTTNRCPHHFCHFGERWKILNWLLVSKGRRERWKINGLVWGIGCVIIWISNIKPRCFYEKYRISANSFRGNYSFLEVGVRQLFKGGNYSREETIYFLISCMHTYYNIPIVIIIKG